MDVKTKAVEPGGVRLYCIKECTMFMETDLWVLGFARRCKIPVHHCRTDDERE
jgi:hypothetical protein